MRAFGRYRSFSGARELGVVAIAAALAGWSLVDSLVQGDWVVTPGAAAWADETFAELRAVSGRGERIGVLVPPQGTELDREFAVGAQYALAPALVRPVYLKDCVLGTGTDGCRTDVAERFALPVPDAPTVEFLGRRLGLKPVGRAGGVLLLERSRP